MELEEIALGFQETITNMGYPCTYKRGSVGCRFITMYFDLNNPSDSHYINKRFLKELECTYNKTFGLLWSNEHYFGIRYENDNQFVLTERLLDYNKGGWKVPIGLDTENNQVYIDFEKTGHLLVAGATGSGKSVALTTIVDGLLLRHPCNEFYFIDPKRVEFNKYSFLCSRGNVVKYELEAIDRFLGAMVADMESAYWYIDSEKITCEEYASKYRKFVVIDELADIMISQYGHIEENLIRLAQKGRACGIHLIMATQNPLVKVFNSLLKANTTTRLCLKCANRMQSMCILDHSGGETLLGNGDAILKTPTSVDEIRLQVALFNKEDEKINLKEVEDIRRKYDL